MSSEGAPLHDPLMFDDDMADIVDETTVRNLLRSLGYPNPTPEAIQQTMLETQRAYREQQMQLADDDVVEGELYYKPSTVHQQRRPTDAVLEDDDDERLLDYERAAPRLPPRRVSEEHRHRDDVNVSEGLIHDSVAHASSTGVSTNNLKFRQQNALNSVPPRLTATGNKLKATNAITIPSTASSTASVRAPDRYHRRPSDPLHLQHYAPYVKMQQEEDVRAHSAHQEAPGSIRGLSEPRDDPRPQSAPKRQQRKPSASAVNRSNVIYAMTGDPVHRPIILTARGASGRQATKHCDPVTRGAMMRKAWQQDDFLSQKGRKEERWQVRRSMLSWEA